MFTREKQEMKRVPMMPVRDMVIFPQQMTPFIVGREASVRALEEALAGDKKIFLSTQHDASVDDPKPEEIYAVGTLANIVQSVKLPDGNIKVLVEGVERARALSIATEEGFFRATIRLLGQRVEDSPQVKQLVEKVTGLYEQFIKLSQSLNYDTMIAAARGDDPSRLSDTIAANLQLPVDEKQDLLETVDPLERLNRIGDILEIELEKLNVDRNINTRVKRQMESAQKEYYLNEKLKAIQKELGRGEKSETDELKKKVDNAGMPPDVHEKAIQELKKLELMPPMSAESTVSRNYLDWLLAVPWKKKSKEIRNIDRAEKILNEDHYGLEKIKERILEFLDVEYDLSQVFFVATANVMHTIPAPLQDRMEVLRLHGYTELEKIEIAKQYLVKKQMASTGLTGANVTFAEGALQEMIRSYTREAGVRNLEREIGNVCRKVARKVVREGANSKVAITAENVSEY